MYNSFFRTFEVAFPSQNDDEYQTFPRSESKPTFPTNIESFVVAIFFNIAGGCLKPCGTTTTGQPRVTSFKSGSLPFPSDDSEAKIKVVSPSTLTTTLKKPFLSRV